MRILIDATPLQTGHRQRGVGTYTRELLRALLAIDQENEYRLIVHGAGQGGRRKEEGGRRKVEGGRWKVEGGMGSALGMEALPANVELVHLPRPGLGRLTGFVTHQALLPALLARERADLFHSPGFVAAFSVPGVPWRCRQPLVLTVHDFIPVHVPELFNDKAINRWWYGRQMRLAGRAARLICVSEATRQDALRFLRVPAARCTVIHEGVDRQVFHPRPPGHAPAARPFILFIGGDFPNKNRPAALAAFAQLTAATQFPHDLVLVGQDSTPEAELACRYPGLNLGRLRRLPHVSRAELADLYRDADLFVFPSTCEGFGLPVLEAMASGAPVITSTASSLPEIAGDAALLVDPGDSAALAAAMQHVLSDRSLHQRLRAAGLARAGTFTWEATARQTLDAYREVAEQGKA